MNRSTRVASGLSLALLLACGSEQPAARPAPAAAAEASAPAAGSEAAAAALPRVASLRFEPAEPQPGEELSVIANTAGAAGGSSLEYHWRVRGRAVGSEGARILLPELRRGDAVEVSVLVRRGELRGEPVSLMARVANRAPRIRDLRLHQQQAGQEEERWVADVQADDPDADEVSFEYSWLLNGRPTDETGDSFPAARLKRGDRLNLRVVVSDGDERSPAAESGEISVANAAPEILSKPPRLDASGVFRYALEAKDPDGDRSLRFELVEGPSGMNLDPMSGELVWTPELDQAGRHRIEVAVDDRHGGRSTQVFILPIVVKSEEPGASPAALP
jgi:hypothetical protein